MADVAADAAPLDEKPAVATPVDATPVDATPAEDGATPEVVSKVGDSCVPDPKGRDLQVVKCQKVCLGSPPLLASSCTRDDVGDVVGPFWLMRKVTIYAADRKIMQADVAFGPLDPVEAGDFAIVRLQIRVAGDGLGIELADDPTRSCDAARVDKTWDYKKDANFRKAVDRVCNARGVYRWTDGRFVPGGVTRASWLIGYRQCSAASHWGWRYSVSRLVAAARRRRAR